MLDLMLTTEEEEEGGREVHRGECIEPDGILEAPESIDISTTRREERYAG